MGSSKPAIVFVPGAWHSPSHFAPTIELLEEAGYSTRGVHLPSVRNVAPWPDSHYPDSEAVRNVILSALDGAEKNVILVMHSYGGVPGGDACRALAKHDRLREGKSTGIVGLVYIAAFAPDEGESLNDARRAPARWEDSGVSIPSCCPGPRSRKFAEGKLLKLKSSQDHWAMPENPISRFYHDVPLQLAEHATSLLKKHSKASFASPVSYAPWKYIPSTYIVADEDRIAARENQERMARQEGGMWSEGLSLGEVHVSTSHSPFLSRPEWMSTLIRKVAWEPHLELGDECK